MKAPSPQYSSGLLYLLGGPRNLAALGLATGAVVVISDGDLLVLFSLQLALVEAQGTFQNVFDLFSKETKIMKRCTSL